jgi:hypothetical protein
MPITVTTRYNRIPEVKARVTDRNVDAVRDAAYFMRDYAQTIAPVLTGAFRSSIYVNINSPEPESGYAEAVARALRLRPKAGIVPEQQAANLDSNVGRQRNTLGQFTLPEAIVSSAVEYAAFLEDGTVYIGPRPTFRQAGLAAEPSFRTDVSNVADGF